MINLCNTIGLLLTLSTLASTLPHLSPRVPKDPNANGNGTYAADYTGAIYGYGFVDVHNAKTRETIGCLDQYAKLVAPSSLHGTAVCAEYWIWNWQFEVMNDTTHGSRGVVSFENANRDMFFPQPDTQDVWWIYTIARVNWITDFWMLNGLITANDENNNRNNVSVFYAANIPKGAEQVNVTSSVQDVALNWVWKPNCKRNSDTKFCGQSV
ncbi:hypothetical protein BDV96DRAFT_684074 [Lophiotrema nucula]|uniref:Concanavalin A-like lectin/glucanase domain-containing protein n=1 Tax=Lophiotrema nucula TaxID=690887 RepID=A0A6A5ZIX2_9PLEO|nr:hypothetical protein BDV96DRAFT_684074 [Lophiotrema nucula]